jgi:hypothetical protein
MFSAPSGGRAAEPVVDVKALHAKIAELTLSAAILRHSSAGRAAELKQHGSSSGSDPKAPSSAGGYLLVEVTLVGIAQ